MTVENVRKNSSVLTELEGKGTIKMVGAMYNLQTAAVEFFS
jgi:carbonic anhydrase